MRDEASLVILRQLTEISSQITVDNTKKTVDGINNS